MLQDVQELRSNKWVPRSHQENSLKTIDQVGCVVEFYRPFSSITNYDLIRVKVGIFLGYIA